MVVFSVDNSNRVLQNQNNFYSMSPSDISGCIAYYKFNEGIGSLLYDEISAAYNGSIVGAFTRFSTGRIGSSLETHDLSIGQVQATIYSNNALNSIGSPNNSFSISCWINGYTPLNTQDNRILEKVLFVYPFTFRMLQVSGGTNAGSPYFEIYDGTYNSSIIGPTLNINQWYHLICVRDVNLGSIYLYVNGNLNGSEKDTTTEIIYNNANINLLNVFPAKPFNGKLDELAFYDRALTPTEVNILYNLGSFSKINLQNQTSNLNLISTPTNLTLTNQYNISFLSPSGLSGCVGYWNFNEGTGSIVYDYSGYGNNGSIIGSVIYFQSGAKDLGYREGLTTKIYCPTLSGGNYVSIDNPPNQMYSLSGGSATGQLAFSWMMNFDSAGSHTSYRQPWGKSHGTSGHEYACRNTWDWPFNYAKPSFTFFGSPDGTQSIGVNFPNVQLDKWYHYCVNGSFGNPSGLIFWLYQNGALTGSGVKASYPKALGPGSITPLTFFTRMQATNQAVMCQLDEFSIFNRLLNEDEIRGLYNGYTSKIILKGGS